MLEVRRGTLSWKGSPKAYGGGPWRGRTLAVVDGQAHRRLDRPERVLSSELRSLSADELSGLDVEFDWDGNQVRAVRRASAVGATAATAAGGAEPPAGFEYTESGRLRPASSPALPTPSTSALAHRPVDEFHNPYTFIPLLDRRASVFPDDNRGLADGVPAGHDTYLAGTWSGRIGVTLTTETPLLLLDTAAPEAVADDHAIYGPALRDGAVHLSQTAVKGMLRSAYEAATNSRLGVFTGHDKRLGYRPQAKANLVPAQVGPSRTSVELLLGTSPPVLPKDGKGVLHAAWLPAYGRSAAPLLYADRSRPEHGDEVTVLLRLYQHYSRKGGGPRKANFRYWRVVSIARKGEPLPPAREATEAESRDTSLHEPLTEELLTDGTVFATNQNFSKKHDERIFFGQPQSKTITSDILDSYSDLVANYREAHRHQDIFERSHQGGHADPAQYIGSEPGKTAWSPHLYEEGAELLKPGDLCYAELDRYGQRVVGLYPVLISRRLYDASPVSLLPAELKPASHFGELSPADRVFGWVNTTTGHGAYRGQLRIGPVDTSDARLETFGGRGLPLAILGQPKPQQGRFYATAAPPNRGDRKGNGKIGRSETSDNKAEKGDWYTERGSLRGRKVYRHHAGLPDRYWAEPTEDRTQEEVDGRYQEYRRPRKGIDDYGTLVDGKKYATLDPADPEAEQRNNQNRSVTAWVAPRSVLRFSLEVVNLSSVELGALVWLLRLPPQHFHRLGFGKPLGFGSVRLDIDSGQTCLRDGDDWRNYYASFASDVPGADPDLDHLIREFERACDVWPKRPHLAAFRANARGDDKIPVHYPRVRPTGDAPYKMDESVPVPPDPRGRTFAWFAANEAASGRKLPLPPATGDPLQVFSVENKGKRDGPSHPRRSDGRRPDGFAGSRRPPHRQDQPGDVGNGATPQAPRPRSGATPAPGSRSVPRPGPPRPRPGPPVERP